MYTRISFEVLSLQPTVVLQSQQTWKYIHLQSKHKRASGVWNKPLSVEHVFDAGPCQPQDEAYKYIIK